MSDLDHAWMARALQLARKGLYSTHPNPRVGCVIVRDGQLIGEGWHLRAGEPHAEVHALREAGEAARGATAYVSLEPCSHHGRTPPCAEALVEAGVARVVAAMQDPNPQVAGRGLARLRSVGIEVACGVLENEARALNAGFVKRMESGLPYLRAKLAMSLDGRTAMASGESQWITGPAARAEVQRLRAQSSVVVTGADTVLMDAARRRPGDPLALATGHGGAAVEAHGEFGAQVRQAAFHALDETDVERPRLGFQHPAGDLNADAAQPRQPAPGDLRIGVLHGGDYPRDTGLDQRLGAGRRAAAVAAGFQRHIRSGAARAVAGLAQRVHLSVRLTRTHMPAFADQLPVLDDHAADPGVRMGRIQALARQLQRARHPGVVEIGHGFFAGSRDRRSISSRNSLRSWKRR